MKTLLALLLAASISLAQAPTPSPTPAQSTYTTEQFVAGYKLSIEAVKSVLKSPATARFSEPQCGQLVSGPMSFHGVVDAQNGFGALLRGKWYSQVAISGTGYQILYADIDGEPFIDKIGLGQKLQALKDLGKPKPTWQDKRAERERKRMDRSR